MTQTAIKWVSRTFDASSLLLPDTYPDFSTSWGILFQADCLAILPRIKSDVIDTVFADPPFNIGKRYRDNTNDERPEAEYLLWCKPGSKSASAC